MLVIEHNLDVIKTADYLIDLGPEGGDRGGTIVATGTPEEVAKNAKSFTGAYLVPVLARPAQPSGTTCPTRRSSSGWSARTWPPSTISRRETGSPSKPSHGMAKFSIVMLVCSDLARSRRVL